MAGPKRSPTRTMSGAARADPLRSGALRARALRARALRARALRARALRARALRARALRARALRASARRASALRGGAQGRSLALQGLSGDVIMSMGVRRSADASLPRSLPTRIADAAPPGVGARRDAPTARASRPEWATGGRDIEGPAIEGSQIEGPGIAGSRIAASRIPAWRCSGRWVQEQGIGGRCEPWIRTRWVRGCRVSGIGGVSRIWVAGACSVEFDRERPLRIAEELGRSTGCV
jgi:hypothetical protein